MSWMKGTGPVKDVSAVGVSRGLSEDWYSNTGNRGEIKKGDFWDVIDNPLYQVAAEAKGYDWDEWVKESKGLVGTGPNDGTVRVRATIKAGTLGGPTRGRRKKEGGWTTNYASATQPEYEYMTRAEAEERGLSYEKPVSRRWRNKETGEIMVGAPDKNSDSRTRMLYLKEFGPDPSSTKTTSASMAGSADLFFMSRIDGDWGDYWEEARDWNVGDAGIAKDLDEISSYLVDIVNINDHLHPIIREGPKGEHYGIEGDVWEYYGLDKEPEPPKEMDWDSAEKKMNLKVADKNTRTYSTPKGITPINLHGDD